MAQRADQTPLLWIGDYPVFRFCGAEDNGGGDQGGSGGSQNSGGEQGSDKSGQASQGGAGTGAQGGGQSTQPETVSKADFDALMARMQAADQNKTKAEQRVAELEGKDKTELEKAQQQLADAAKTIETLTGSQTNMLITNEFLTVKDSPTWHNSKAALQLLDRSLVTIDAASGTVKGMEAAVNKLKTDHPYLIKPADKEGEGEQGGDGKPTGKPSGSSNNGSGGGGKGPDRAALEKRFPALRGRG